MKRKYMWCLVVMILFLTGCHSNEESDPELKSQIHALNEEVIKYIDRLEEREETIKKLEIQIESQEKVVENLKQELEQKTDEMTALNEEMARVVLEKGERLNKEETEVVSGTHTSPESNDEALTSVQVKSHVVELGDSEAVIPYDELVILSEVNERIGQGNKGTTYRKTLANESIRIQLEGPNEETYSVVQMELDDSQFALTSGLKVGTSVAMLERYLETTSLNVKTYRDAVLEVYEVEIDERRSVIFQIDQQKIQNILMIEQTP